MAAADACIYGGPFQRTAVVCSASQRLLAVVFGCVLLLLLLQYVFLEEPQWFNAALYRTTAPYLPPGVADKLIHREEQERLDKVKQQEQQQQAPAAAAPGS